MCDGRVPILPSQTMGSSSYHSSGIDTSGSEARAAPDPKPSALGCFNDAELNRLIDAAHARLYPPERHGNSWSESYEHSQHRAADAAVEAVAAAATDGMSGMQQSPEQSTVEMHASMCSAPSQARGDTAEVPEWRPAGAERAFAPLQQPAPSTRADRSGLAQATAAAAAAAAAAIAVSGGNTPAEPEELATMRAETERLHHLLADLLAKEASTGHLPDGAGRHVAATDQTPAAPEAVTTRTTLGVVQYPQQPAESPRVDVALQTGDEPSEIEYVETVGGSLYSSTLLSTARAHAENRKLERDLRKLREVANSQRGEASWLIQGLQKHVESSESLSRTTSSGARQQRTSEVTFLDAEEADTAGCRRRVQVWRNPWESADDHQREGSLSMSQDDRGLAVGGVHVLNSSPIRPAAEADKRDEHQAFTAGSASVPRAVPARAVISPALAPRVQCEHAHQPAVEERSAAQSNNASPSMVDAAVAACVENRRLRRELQGLRALAHWQQGEVGMMAASDQEVQRPTGEISKCCSQGQLARGASAWTGVEDYDRSVREEMWRICQHSREILSDQQASHAELN